MLKFSDLASSISMLLIQNFSFQGEDLRGLDVKVLEELQNFHVEALSRICQEKVWCFTCDVPVPRAHGTPAHACTQSSDFF